MVSKHPILLRALDPEGGVRVCTDEEYLTFVAGITALLQVAEVAVSLDFSRRGEGRVCRDTTHRPQRGNCWKIDPLSLSGVKSSQVNAPHKYKIVFMVANRPLGDIHHTSLNNDQISLLENLFIGKVPLKGTLPKKEILLERVEKVKLTLVFPSHPNFFGSSQARLIGGQIWNPIPFSRVGAQKSSYTELGSVGFTRKRRSEPRILVS